MTVLHDHHIKRVSSRNKHKAYGMGLGIMLLDDVYPGFPGDVRNASAYPFPIQYEVVEGVDIQRLVYAEDKSLCLEPLQHAALELEDMGCRAIAAECGYFSFFQREIAEHVNVPVFMSSLLQVPLAQQLIGSEDVVGILVANKSAVVDRHLEAVGINLGSNYVLAGAMDGGRCPEFDHIWTEELRTDPPTIDYEKAEKLREYIAKNFKIVGYSNDIKRYKNTNPFETIKKEYGLPLEIANLYKYLLKSQGIEEFAFVFTGEFSVYSDSFKNVFS